MNQLKAVLLRSPLFVRVYESLFQRPLRDIFGRRAAKKALFVYSTYHFKKKDFFAHSSYQESVVISEIFDQLGYRVDVVNNNRLTRLDLKNYDLIFGEGLPMFQAIQQSVRARIIYYATGSHPWQCTEASLARLSAFYARYRALPLESTRVQDYRWGIAASSAEAVICIGNETTRATFLARGAKHTVLVNPSFHFDQSRAPALQRDISASRKSALWFGSYGLLHKGLDLAIEAVRQRPDWTLHVCGHTAREKAFLHAIDIPDNVHVHGFMNIDSAEFRAITARAMYVILPSCSEGLATSVITAMGRGAMIPLVSAECGVDIGDFGIAITELSVDAVLGALAECDRLGDAELLRMSTSAWQAAQDGYSLANYRATMERHFENLLGNK
jgi:glycosyltransferase involved in cell wall biosynthesis